MGLFDFLRRGAARPSLPAPPEEPIFAVPVAAMKRAEPGEKPRETSIFYAFLFAKSAPVAVERLKRELRDEGMEFIALKGKVIEVPLHEWTHFVTHRFEWIADLLPTAQQISDGSRAAVYYTPKITKYGA